MKIIYTLLIILTLIFSASIFAQNKIEITKNGFSIHLNFNEPRHLDKVNGIVTVRDYLDFTDVSKAGKFKLPEQTYLIAIPPFSKPEIKIADLKEEVLKNIIPTIQPKIKLLNDSTLVNEDIDYRNALIDNNDGNFLEVIGYSWYHNLYCAEVKIATHFFDVNLNQLRIIKSANIIVDLGNNYSMVLTKTNLDAVENSTGLDDILLNAQIANQFLAKQPLTLNDSTGNWINYASEYLKIGTAKDDLFRITKADLDANGINTSLINPKSFRLIESGIEVPITVFGEEDGSFDENDYIQFYGTLNYPKISYREINPSDKPYNEYLNRYTDTTFYFLTWGLQDGARIQSSNSFVAGLQDTLNYYMSLTHVENNVVYFSANVDEISNQTPGWLKNKTWYNSQTVWLYSNTTRNYNFTAEDVVPNKTAKFYYKAVSGGSNIVYNAHQVILKVNGVLIDSQSINRNEQVLLSGTLNSNQFLNNPNVISAKNYSNGTNPNFLATDWYDIEYPRLLKLNNDFLLFKVDDNLIDGLKLFNIANATSASYEIYKVKPFFRKIDNYQIISNQLFFTDTVKSGDQYIIVSSTQIDKPVFYYKKQFVNLRSSTNQADYLAITHPKFLQSARNYINAIANMYGVTNDLVSVVDIFDEFGFGYPTPESIRLFNAVTYQNRQEPKPQYLTLIGDADYDYKMYVFKNFGVKGGGNFVPSFGIPVSDNWLVIWDETALPIPQMKVGRIPINTNEELDYYLSKIQNNFNERFGEWNKRYLFFSGGSSNLPSEIAQLKAVNDQVINNFIKPMPISGSYTHFYKTSNPLTDFGPYTSEEFANAIYNGGVFISYLGHSGTATWDNSISEPIQLKNGVNRNTLITDFGCSTNKFAEPDIVCFGERFLLGSDGQALGYVGNSSLGFTTTSLTVPLYFYKDILESESKEVGNAHLESKIQMFQNLGSSSVYKLFSLTNTLLGDPIIKIKVPNKPNLNIQPSDILLGSNVINDSEDSIKIKIVFCNFGLKDSSKFNYTIQHFAGGDLIKTIFGRRDLPSFKDTIDIWVTVKNQPGENSLAIILDSDNEINEIYKDDNNLTYNFYVYSTELRDLIKQRFENAALNKITVLNPSLFNYNIFNIKYQISESAYFQNYREFIIPADSFFTNLPIASLNPSARYWIRYEIDDQNSVYSDVKSFYNSGNYDYFLIDSVSYNNQLLNNLIYSENNLSISKKSDNISVTSAGFEAGATCVIAKNGINLLSNTFFAGMGIVVFDDVTMTVDTSTWYNLFNNPTNMQALVNLINSIPQGKIVAMGVSDDAANNITVDLKNAIKTLGSTKIDSITFRGSWALIGKKGSAPGDVLEEVRGRYDGLIYIDSTFITPITRGSMETTTIGPASNWQSAVISQNIPSGSSIQHFVYGIKPDGNIDSLGNLNFVNNITSLGFINPEIYPKIKIKSEFDATPEGVSPKLSSFGVDYVGVSELGTNYQVVSVDNDTIPAGGNINLSFWVYNVGEANADSFNVKVDVVNHNNSSTTIFNQLITSLAANSKQKFEVNYQDLGNDNQKRFLINIDPENKISEYYKDNNFFSEPFYVKPDITPPSVKITFDDVEVLNGDFVSKTPDIKIALSDESPVPIVDTSAIKIYLNEQPVFYMGNSNIITYTFNNSNPKFVVEYKPELKDGDYLLRVVAKDQGGNLVDSASSEVYFVVSSETKLLQVYNYPNPFSNETYFTFRLSQIPDEVKIRIFTIAGRMIKEIIKKSSELNFDLNKIYWDGKDEDGDVIANGTYLYKVIMKIGDKTESVNQKLVIVK